MLIQIPDSFSYDNLKESCFSHEEVSCLRDILKQLETPDHERFWYFLRMEIAWSYTERLRAEGRYTENLAKAIKIGLNMVAKGVSMEIIYLFRDFMMSHSWDYWFMPGSRYNIAEAILGNEDHKWKQWVFCHVAESVLMYNTCGERTLDLLVSGDLDFERRTNPKKPWTCDYSKVNSLVENLSSISNQNEYTYRIASSVLEALPWANSSNLNNTIVLTEDQIRRIMPSVLSPFSVVEDNDE
ncbi:MAG: hypothetical protein AAGM67_00240 [Bacteroidota bacterium]